MRDRFTRLTGHRPSLREARAYAQGKKREVALEAEAMDMCCSFASALWVIVNLTALVQVGPHPQGGEPTIFNH